MHPTTFAETATLRVAEGDNGIERHGFPLMWQAT